MLNHTNGSTIKSLICPSFVAFFGCSIAYLFINAMAYPLDHNEHMYITAGYLAQSKTLYRDFAFLQMPYLPILYSHVFSITGAERLLFTGRLCTFLFCVASVLLIWLACYRVTRDVTLSSGALGIFSFSPFLACASGESSNYMMPIALSLFAFWVYTGVLDDSRFKSLRMFLVGLALALATGAKLYYGPFLLGFLLFSFVFPKMWPLGWRLSQLVAPMFAGMLLGLVPVIYYLANFPEAFVFDNLGYHLINSQWRGFELENNFGYRIGELMRFFFYYPANLAFAILIPYAFLRAVSSNISVKITALANDEIVVLSAYLSSLGLVVALIPLPTFIYFFAAPFPFMVILSVALIHRIPRIEWWGKDGFVFSLVMLVTIISGATNLYERLPDFVDFNRWTGIRVHRTSEDIRKLLEPLGQGDLVATLSPLYAIESRLPIYVEFASGPFLYRVGDLLSTQELKTFRGVSPKRITEMFEKKPPFAIIVGAEDVLDAPLRAYAEEKQFVKVGVGLIELYKKAPSGVRLSEINKM
jgi:hypothetical protein